MSYIGTTKPKEYSDQFDQLRQNRVELSFHKYGTGRSDSRIKSPSNYGYARSITASAKSKYA